jgi:hypothetical protein
VDLFLKVNKPPRESQLICVRTRSNEAASLKTYYPTIKKNHLRMIVPLMQVPCCLGERDIIEWSHLISSCER